MSCETLQGGKNALSVRADADFVRVALFRADVVLHDENAVLHHKNAGGLYEKKHTTWQEQRIDNIQLSTCISI